MFGNMRIFPKLVIMAGLAILGVGLVTVVGLVSLKNNLLEARKNKLQEIVLMARDQLDRAYEDSRAAKLSEADTMNRIKTLIRTMRYDGKEGYFYAYDMDGVVAAHPSKPREGMNLMDFKDSDGNYFTREHLDLVRKGQSGFVTFRYPHPGTTDPILKIAYVTEFKPYRWPLASVVLIDDINATFWSRAREMSILSGIILLLVAGLSVLVGRSIVNPITNLTAAMRKLAAGDTGTAIPAIDRRDEVGAMARSVQVFKDSMIDAARLRGDQEALKAQTEAEKRIMLSQMADEFESGVLASLGTLGQAASGMRTTSQGMSVTAEETSRQAATVSAAAEQATANVQAVAAATEELSSSVAEISRQVSHSTAIVAKAVQEAGQTDASVQSLTAAAQKIGDVVKLINDIASQTNLLALNATIEAARAGDAGKGFAVVAGEVKILASQTAKATGEISGEVAAMQAATKDVVQAIEAISATIASIDEIATTIASAVEEQGAATKEIARNVQQAALGTGQVSQNILGVNQAASEAGAAAGGVLSSSEELGQQSAKLRSDLDSFLASIRAA